MQSETHVHDLQRSGEVRAVRYHGPLSLAVLLALTSGRASPLYALPSHHEALTCRLTSYDV